MSWPCFLVEPTDKAFRYLRRYRSAINPLDECPLEHGYHDAMFPLGEGDLVFDGKGGHRDAPDFELILDDDPRWPTHCACGYEFTPDDPKQRFSQLIYTDGVGRWSLRDLPVGGMYYADWLGDDFYWSNPFGRMNLHVVTPGGEWNIDARASNCTLPNDRQHRCWVRHGDPPHITVDKAGLTCAAGAGSIAQKAFHGFLRNGTIIPC